MIVVDIILMSETNNREIVIEGLMNLGLTEREARVYLAILSTSYATAPKIQKLSKVPQSKIYAILDNLVHIGYCSVRKEGRIRTFEAVDPEKTLDAPIKKLKSMVSKSIELRELLHNIYSSAKEPKEPIEYIEVFHGSENIHNRYCELVNKAKKEILGFGREPYTFSSPGKIDEQTVAEEDILKRGGSTRWVYEIYRPDQSWMIPRLSLMQQKGIQIRAVKSLPAKMTIFDGNTLLIVEEDQNSSRDNLTSFLVELPAIVKSFVSLFEHYWNLAQELEEWKVEHPSIGIAATDGSNSDSLITKNEKIH